MDTMKRLVPFGLVLLATACSGAADEGDESATPVALVKLATASTGGAAHVVPVFGAADPGPAARMSLVAPAEATVASIAAPAGTAVRAGQIVVALAASPVLRADAAKAASDAAAADAALARAIRMRGDGLMSDADVETARAAATAADAQRRSFGVRAAQLSLRAPADGTVDSVAVAKGDLLQPGAAVATIMRKGDVRARFGVDPGMAAMLRPGMTVTVSGAGGRVSFSAPIESVSAAVDPQTRLASIFVRIPAGSAIVAGETLSASVDVGGSGSAVTIPYPALLDDGGQAFVYVVEQGVAHRHEVTTEPSTGDRVAVSKGLKAGDRVVVEGGTGVKDGMKVRTR